MEERRDATLPTLQIAQYQATHEITATDTVVRGSVAGETRLGVCTAMRTIFSYHRFLEHTKTDQSNASQKAKGGRERVLDPK
jgi:hypothetical protein